MSCVTTLLAPITQRSPMLTPLVTTTFAPSQQLSPIRVGPLLSKPCQVIGVSGSSKRWLGVGDEAAVGEHAVLADLDQLLGGDHHAHVQELPAPIRTRALPGAVIHTPGSSSTPAPTSRRPSRSASSTLPWTRPAHEGLAAHELPVDPRPVPGQRAALVPAPLLRPQAQPRARASAPSAPLTAATLARRRRGARRLCLAGAAAGVEQLGEELPGVRGGLGRDLLGRAGGDRHAALLAALRAQVDDPVGALDDVEVVLDHDHAVARVDEPLEHLQQALDVGEVQAGGRLVEDVEGPCRSRSSTARSRA